MLILIKSTLQSALSSPLLKKTGTVMAGTLAAQAILIGSVPFLSRMYSVAQFGELGMFMLIAMFGTQLLSWRYDFGIAAAPGTQEAGSLLSLCFVVGIWSSIIFFIILIFLAPFFTERNAFALLRWLPIIILYAYSYAMWNALTFYNIRISAFRKNAYLNVARALFTVGISVVLFWLWSGNGMIIGLALGQALATLSLFLFTLKKIPGKFISRTYFGNQQLLQTAKSNSLLVRYSLPSAFVELLSGQLPQYLIGAFGQVVFGWFSQANRLLNAPLDLVGQSVRAVFWETAGKTYRQNGNCIRIFDRIMVRLFGFSIIPFLLLFLFSSWLFAFILGPDWEPAGNFARILIPLCFFRFISNPLSSMFYIANKQQYDLLVQAGILVLVISLLIAVPVLALKVEQVLVCYTFIYSIKYLVELAFSRRFAQGNLLLINSG